MEYELVHEIQNLCRNNQMRDVFFEEDLRRRLSGHKIELSADPGSNGAVTIHAVVDGLMEKYVFTPI